MFKPPPQTPPSAICSTKHMTPGSSVVSTLVSLARLTLRATPLPPVEVPPLHPAPVPLAQVTHSHLLCRWPALSVQLLPFFSSKAFVLAFCLGVSIDYLNMRRVMSFGTCFPPVSPVYRAFYRSRNTEKMEWPARLHERTLQHRICSLGRVFWFGNIYWQIENKRSALLRACVWIGSTNET